MNKVVLIGRCVKDSELNFTAGTGTAVTRFTLAVPRPFKKDETDFINCVSFGKRAETIGQYFTKGKQVAIEGHIQVSKYQDKEGNNRYSTDVIVDSFEFIGNSTSNNSQENTSYQNNLGGMSFEEDTMPVDDSDMPF